jgi:hypothetical protein
MRLRRTTLAAAAVASMGLLGACTSQPSEKAVMKDVIESIDLPEAQQACMLEIVDGMSSDEIEQLGQDNEDVPISSSDTGDAEMTALIDSFEECQPSS